MSRLFSKSLLFSTAAVLFLCCSSNEDPLDNENFIDRESDIRLVFEEHADLDQYKASIESLISGVNLEIQKLMPIKDVLIRVSVNRNQSIPEIGIGGFNPSPNEVLIFIDPNFNNLKNSLEMELAAMISHEMHHAKRRRSVGYGNTLLQAVISEGLADHFSIEVTGIDTPRWSNVFQDDQLETWIDTASQTWNDSPYDHSSWFFGSNSIPRWTGYSIGYDLVEKYLAANPDKKPSTLFDETANSFTP